MNMKALLIGTIFGVSMTLISIQIFAYFVRQTESDIEKSLKLSGMNEDDRHLKEL